MMPLLADENVSRLIVERLRAAGFDAKSIGATSAGASDNVVLAIATGEGRILITEDRDFGEMVVRQRLEVPGPPGIGSLVERGGSRPGSGDCFHDPGKAGEEPRCHRAWTSWHSPPCAMSQTLGPWLFLEMPRHIDAFPLYYKLAVHGAAP
jgi:hypothetical protein